VKLAACQRFNPNAAPPGWQIEPIKNHLRLEYGTGLIEVDRQQGEFPVFGSNGCVGYNNAFLVEGPGILVGRKGSVGEVHFSEKSFWPIDTVYYVRRLSNDNWRYLYYLLKFLNLPRLNAATGVPGLTRRDAHFIFGAFPESKEQEAIAELLDFTEEVYTAVQKKLSAARRLKQALLEQLFTGGVPDQHKDFQTSKVLRHDFKAPASWNIEALGLSLLSVEYGTNEPSNDAKLGLPVVAIPQVIAPRFRLGECSYVELSGSEATALKLAQDDVLLVRTNGNPEYIGKSTVVGDGAEARHIVFASYLIRVRTDKTKLRGRYLNYFLASPLGRRQCLAMANTSAGNHNLGARSIKQFCIPRPSPDEQDDIVTLIDAAEDAIEAAETERSFMERLTVSMLQSLFTGRVRVRY
jgi:type I restriction enzyme S subunit